MYQNSNEFAEYPEYTNRSNEVDYSHPEYYQPVAPSPPRPAQSAQSVDPYAGYVNYIEPAVADPYTEKQRQEYQGPATLDGYVTGEGTEQHEEDRREEAGPGERKRKGGLAGVGGVIIAIGAWLLKLKSLAFFWTGISALFSIAIYALAYGWVFAFGLVAQLFIHEMGHAIVMKLKGIPIGGMIFIPMLGAAVMMRQMPKNARDEAEVGIAGPIAGALAATFCLFMAQRPGASPFWAALAYFGFFINLFNLIPIVPFDGGRVLAAIDRRVWLLGFVGLLAFQIWSWMHGSASPWLIFLILMAATQLWSRGFSRSMQENEYYAVPVGTRIIISVLYFGLAASLFLGMSIAHALLPVAG